MIRLTSITTKRGDDGTTSLGDGSRRLKHDLRIEAYGTVDETNSMIGLARAYLVEAGENELASCLGRVQNDLFDLGADLCQPDHKKPCLRIEEDYTRRLEADCSRLNEGLAPLDSFILPAGSTLIATLHLARTTARRAERRIVSLQSKEEINPETLRYMNRLSDLLFIIARFIGRDKEEKWVAKG